LSSARATDRQNRAGKTGRHAEIVMNVSPISFDRDATIDVGWLPYEEVGDSSLKCLRDIHNLTHVFRREGKDRVGAVPVVSGTTFIGTQGKIKLGDHLGLTAALVRNSLINYLTRAEPSHLILRTNPVHCEKRYPSRTAGTRSKLS
jgi:hypothetical protein